MSPEAPRSRRVTLADVGKHCGVHRTTVGLALRNDPSIPEATRERIQAAAKELGYHPDPALASLVAYRHQKAGARFRATIAVISDSDYGVKYWRTHSPVGQEQYLGLTQQAEALGYTLEEYSVGQDRHHCRRVNSILRARGISAAIITGLSNLQDPIELDWPSLSAVSMSYSLSSPAIPRVTTQHRSNASLAIRELIGLGYKRIGFVTTPENERRVDHAWSAGVLSECFHHRNQIEHQAIRMDPETNNAANPALLDWINRERLDVLVSTQQHVLNYLEAEGFDIPGELGFVSLDLSSSRGRISGIDQNGSEIGRETINILSGMQTNNLRGIPRFQHVHLVRGLWHPATTTRAPRKDPPAEDAGPA